MIDIIREFPEVKQTLSQIGRTNDGTDPKGFFNVQIQVDLKPKEEWRKDLSEEELIDEMDQQLKKIPGCVFNYSQPIRDNVEEAVAGVNAAMAVKIFGPDFDNWITWQIPAEANIKNVKGIEDLGVIKKPGAA